jgi:hypothetical protein
VHVEAFGVESFQRDEPGNFAGDKGESGTVENASHSFRWLKAESGFAIAGAPL